MTATPNAIEAARKIAREHRAAWFAEFGDPIEYHTDNEIGDWDATSWTEAWRVVSREVDTDELSKEEEENQLYKDCREAYLSALYGK